MTKLEEIAAKAAAETHALGEGHATTVYGTESIDAEAAPGVQRYQVEAVNRKLSRDGLYASRAQIHPRLAFGTFRNIKWLVMAIALGVYYGLPWIRWPRAEGLPDQAILLDFAHQRLFFGPIEIWPQEFYFITGILVISALALFLVTALAGRVWCGYACPQTVWTDLMIAVERFWQGDRNARIKLDKEPWSARKVLLKGVTHLSWLLIGLLTGGALVFYFRDAPTLAVELVTGTAPFIAYLFLGIFTVTTYLLGGIAREQVCIYMCPWPRIQGAMFDRDSMLVTYRAFRGEPRGPHRKNQPWEGRGDCIDCKACVAVCPMGIDIRDGAQLECIQCALCVDACNEIMDKIGRPRSLIAYDTFRNLEAESHGDRVPFRPIRPRTMLYSGLIALVMAVMVLAFLGKTTLEVNVLHDRNPLFVELSDGGVRNGYTVKILNKRQEARRFKLSTTQLEGAQIKVTGFEETADPVIEVKTDNLRELRVYVAVPGDAPGRQGPASSDFQLVVTDLDSNEVTSRTTKFMRPAP